MKTKSVGQMIELIHGLADTKDVTPRTNEFIKSIHASYIAKNKSTSHFTGPQVDAIESIHNEHFG